MLTFSDDEKGRRGNTSFDPWATTNRESFQKPSVQQARSIPAAGQPSTPDFGPLPTNVVPPEQQLAAPQCQTMAGAPEPPPGSIVNTDPINRQPEALKPRYEFTSPIGPFAAPAPNSTPRDELPTLKPGHLHPEGFTQRTKHSPAQWAPISHDLGKNQDGECHRPENYAQRAPNTALVVGTQALPSADHLGYGELARTTASDIGVDQSGTPHSPKHHAQRAPNTALSVGTATLPEGAMQFATTNQDFEHYTPDAIPAKEMQHHALKVGSQAARKTLRSLVLCHYQLMPSMWCCRRSPREA